MSFDINDVAEILNQELGLKPIEEQPVEEIAEEMKACNQEYTPPEWEATEWDGVESRTVAAHWLFQLDKDIGTVKQYRGFESVCPVLVPDVDEDYVVNQDVLETLVRCDRNKLKPLLVGDSGCGKTSIFEFFAAKTGRPFHRQEFDESTDDQKLFGSLEFADGKTYFNATDFVVAMQWPSVIVNDEVCRATTPAQMLLNTPLDRDQVRVVSHGDDKTEVVKAHPDWFIGATDNTAGNGDGLDVYSAANVMDAAVSNRFDVVKATPYASEKVELSIIQKKTSTMSDKDAADLAKFSGLMHTAFTNRQVTSAFSVRNLKAIIKLVDDGMAMKDAIRDNFISRVAKSEQPDVRETMRTVFGG